MPYSTEPTPAELDRYSAAMAAAADPRALMDAATERFEAMTVSQKAADHAGVARAARALGDDCLRLCTVPATDEQAAGEKARFLVIMSRWAWPRRPALSAVMDAAVRAECRTWGDRIMR